MPFYVAKHMDPGVLAPLQPVISHLIYLTGTLSVTAIFVIVIRGLVRLYTGGVFATGKDIAIVLACAAVSTMPFSVVQFLTS